MEGVALVGLEGDLVKLRFGAVHLHYEAVTRITSDNVEKMLGI